MSKSKSKGTIIQVDKDKSKARCRKWQLRVNLGKSARTGKYAAKTRRFSGTYSEAKEALEQFVYEIENGEVQARTCWTFEDYAKHYLEIREAKKEVAPSTIDKQRNQFKAVYAHIGNAELSEITSRDLEDMYIAMLNGDTLSGRPSGGSYVNQIHDNITLVFQFAIKEGILINNPCDAAVPPKMDTKPKKALSKTLSREFISQLDPSEPCQCAYLLAITLGLRRGEICGLSWEDIDFEQHIVNVVHAVDNLGNMKGTKTKAGLRILPLPAVTQKALEDQMVAQALRFAKVNVTRRQKKKPLLEQRPSTPVITTLNSERVLPSSLSRWWSVDRKKFGLENFTLHELRHTYLTLLAQSNVHPKVMQELAGHYSCQITMDIYTHVNMIAKQQAVGAVSNLFPEATNNATLPAVSEPIIVENLVDETSKQAAMPV